MDSSSLCLWLLFFHDQRLGQFLPLAFVGHFDGAARFLTEHVGVIIFSGERRRQVLTAEIVDELQLCLVVTFDLCLHDDPAERVVHLPKVSGQFAIEFLSWHLNILIIKINAQVDIILTINKVRVKSFAVRLGLKPYAKHCKYDGLKQSFFHV